MCFKREVREMHIGMEWLKTPIIATFALFAGFTKDFPGQYRILDANPTWEIQQLTT